VDDRRQLEDRLAVALEQARSDGSLVAVIVGELMGLLVVNARFGVDAGAAAVEEAARRVEAAVARHADAVARIGDAEFAVLLTGIHDRAEAERVQGRITAAFLEPFAIHGEQVEMTLALGLNVGPGRRRTDSDLLWRTAEESGQVRSATMQRVISGVRGDARGIAEVAQTFADEGVRRFGFEACAFDVAGRTWHAPEALPERPPDAEQPLRTEGRVVGWIRWWGPVPDETDTSDVGLILGHIAASLDRALEVDDADHRARTDQLTGLLNREGLVHELRDLDGPYALGVIDLDHFKAINDEHGHDVGDAVLTDLAALLRRGRTDDLIARWGGEEIVIVMPSTTVDGAVARVQRLLEEARSFVRVGDVGPITFSAGVTAREAGEPLPDVFKRADDAMYRAKRAGRARVEVG
jgi:diguanylate cyclase (GGDEF)-like protein